MREYRQYKVTLESFEESLFTKSERNIYNINLYPGNVVDLQWDIYDYAITYAQLVDKNNDPIKFALVETDYENYYSDGQGFLSIEYILGENNEIKVDGYKCDFKINDLEKKVHFLNKVKCKKSL